jgi:hypothetical protein
MLNGFRAELAGKLRADGTADAEALAAALTAGLDGLMLHAVVDDRLDVRLVGAKLLSLIE